MIRNLIFHQSHLATGGNQWNQSYECITIHNLIDSITYISTCEYKFYTLLLINYFFCFFFFESDNLKGIKFFFFYFFIF